MCAAGHATCGGGGGHATYVLEAIEVVLHMVEVVDQWDMCWSGGGLRTFAGRGGHASCTQLLVEKFERPDTQLQPNFRRDISLIPTQ
jgi:hypothetical protein